MFFSHAEEVTLVIRFEGSAWLHPQQSIVVSIMHIGNKASKNQRPSLVGHLLHPLKCAHVHMLGQLASFHGEARSKHFGQHDHICGLAYLPDFLFKHGQISPNILPMKI